jgi:hypothetical protein
MPCTARRADNGWSPQFITIPGCMLCNCCCICGRVQAPCHAATIDFFPPHARKSRSIRGGTCTGVALDLDEVQWIVPALPLERRGPSRQTVVQDASPASAHTHSSSAKTVADINRACSCWHISPHPTTTECKHTALTTNTLATTAPHHTSANPHVSAS